MTQTWRNREELEHQVVSLISQGMSRRAVSRACGVSRNTVKKILKDHARRRQVGHSTLEPAPVRAPRSCKIDPYVPRVKKLLQTYPDITAQRVYEILVEEGFGGGATAVKKRLRILRPKDKPEPSLSTPIYEPGEMGECDWSPYDILFTDGTKAGLQAFGYVLVYSRRKFFSFFLSNDIYALLDGHEQAFSRFKGSPRKCKYDSQKPVVLRWEGTQPIYNPRFIAYSTYYEFQPCALRGNPNGKPRVERSFWELERSFFNGRSFRNVEDLRGQLTHWLDTVADQRRRYGTTIMERFAIESDHLRALPSRPYDTSRITYRVCSIDGFVEWLGNRYAVPYDYVTDILAIRITQQELFVYSANLTCIARHELAPRGKGLKLDPSGFHPPAGRRAASDAEQLQMAFASMGEKAAEFFRLMKQAAARTYCHQARVILALRAEFSTEDIVNAVQHAAKFNAFRADSVRQILLAKSRPRSFEEYVCDRTAQKLAQTIGQDLTEPRDLSEYDNWTGPGSRQPSTMEHTPCERQASPSNQELSNQPSNQRVPDETQAHQTDCVTDSSPTSDSSD
jgi:transposase